MTKIKMTLVAAALAASLGALAPAAQAATAHNIQTGAGTSNTYDSAASAFMKQPK